MAESDEQVGEFIEEAIQELETGDESKTFDERMLRRPLSTLGLRTPVVVETHTSALEAINRMVEARAGCALVVRGTKLKGIFTERDILTRVISAGLDPAKAPLRKVMTAKPECLRTSDAIAYALNKMSLGGYRHVPLVDKSGAPVGIVSVKDIVNYLVAFFPDSVLNLPVVPRADVAREREGA